MVDMQENCVGVIFGQKESEAQHSPPQYSLDIWTGLHVSVINDELTLERIRSTYRQL